MFSFWQKFANLQCTRVAKIVIWKVKGVEEVSFFKKFLEEGHILYVVTDYTHCACFGKLRFFWLLDVTVFEVAEYFLDFTIFFKFSLHNSFCLHTHGFAIDIESGNKPILLYNISKLFDLFIIQIIISNVNVSDLRKVLYKFR